MLTFADIKNLTYPDFCPIEKVLEDLLIKRIININELLESYTNAIERERHQEKCKFSEAITVLVQKLSDNFKDQQDDINKRAIHIISGSKLMPENLYHEKYGYTEEDKKFWDEIFKDVYGFNL